MNEEVEEYVPKKRRRNQNRPGWLTQDIVREIRKKKRLWRKAKAGEGVEEYKKRRFYSYVKVKTKARTGIG